MLRLLLRLHAGLTVFDDPPVLPNDRREDGEGLVHRLGLEERCVLLVVCIDIQPVGAEVARQLVLDLLGEGRLVGVFLLEHRAHQRPEDLILVRLGRGLLKDRQVLLDEGHLLQAVDTAVRMNLDGDYGIPVPDYVEENVSTKVVKIIQSYTGVVDKMVWRKY